MKSSIARKEGFFVDDYFCGHGLGRNLHQKPLIRHHENSFEGFIEEGMVFTIEPIFMLFEHKEIFVWPDQFTVQSKFNLSAQHEEMIYVGKDGPQILTEIK